MPYPRLTIMPFCSTWNRDGVILFSPDYGAIYKIAATGGIPVLVRAEDARRQETANDAPRFLTDGKRFLYWIASPNAEVAGVHLPETRGTDHQEQTFSVPRGRRPPCSNIGKLERSAILSRGGGLRCWSDY